MIDNLFEILRCVQNDKLGFVRMQKTLFITDKALSTGKMPVPQEYDPGHGYRIKRQGKP